MQLRAKRRFLEEKSVGGWVEKRGRNEGETEDICIQVPGPNAEAARADRSERVSQYKRQAQVETRAISPGRFSRALEPVNDLRQGYEDASG